MHVANVNQLWASTQQNCATMNRIPFGNETYLFRKWYNNIMFDNKLGLMYT